MSGSEYINLYIYIHIYALIAFKEYNHVDYHMYLINIIYNVMNVIIASHVLIMHIKLCPKRSFYHCPFIMNLKPQAKLKCMF